MALFHRSTAAQPHAKGPSDATSSDHPVAGHGSHGPYSEGLLEGLGHAISAPLIDGARGADPYLPDPLHKKPASR